MKNRRLINSSAYLLYKKSRLNSPKYSIDALNFSSSRKKISSYRRQEKLTRPSSTSSVFSQRLNFRNDSRNLKKENKSLNVLDLLLENNQNQYNFKKLRKKLKSIDNFYRNESVKSNSRVKEVFYKYNVLYGQNSSNIITTYSPKMRPMSSSVYTFVKKMHNEKKDNLPVFSDNEINQLIKAKCSDMGIDVKEHMLSKFKDYCNAKCKNRFVDLNENFLGINSIKFIGNILYNNDRISKLNLSKNNLGDTGIIILINAIKDSRSLITLNIASNGVTYIGGEVVFKNMIHQQSIIDFNISSIEGSNTNRNRLTFVGIKDIIQFLKENLFIEYFNISGNSIKNEGFISICKGLNENRSLVSLKLSQNEIGEKGIIQGLKYITTPINKLIYLDISKNRILDEGLIALTNQMKDFPNLISLNLSFCGFEFRAFEIFLKNLQYSRKLENLNVSGNKLKHKNFERIKPYFSYFGLRSLNMSKCSLCDDSTFKLGECMEVNNTIRKLNISDNEITDKGFRPFDSLFYKNNSITHFDCSSNYLTNNGIENLIKSLEVNNSLNSLNLYDNQLRTDVGNLILEVMRKNKSLTYINLYFNRIPIIKIEEINRFVQINEQNQKQKFIPNLIRSVKELEFNPKQFEILASKIKDKKIERDFLYKKVKEEDNIYSSIMNEQQKVIDVKKEESVIIHNKIKKLEEQIHNLEKIMLQENKNFKEQEFKLNDRIAREERYLNEELNNKKFVTREYKAIEMENEHIYNLTKEKYNLTERAVRKASLSLSSINGIFNKRTEELNRIMSFKTRAVRKRNTSIKKTAGFFKGKNSMNSTNNKLGSRFSIIKKNEDNGEFASNNLKENEESKQHNNENGNKRQINKYKSKIIIENKNRNKDIKDLELKNKKTMNKTKSEKNILNMFKMSI